MNLQRLKLALVALTLISVVADTMLLPFYPHFFSQVFSVDSPQHVGWYIAACSLTVMTAFPFWSRVARHIDELHLWVVTQLIAAVLGVLCYRSTSLLEFWLLSQTMLVFKASYLLIYPYVMRLEDGRSRIGVAGLFSVLMHFGGIGGALLGAATLDLLEPRSIYLIMASADVLQVIICLYLIALNRVSWRGHQYGEPHDRHALQIRLPSYVVNLGILSLLFYFSVFLIRPFFTRYWESITQFDHHLLTAAAYAIPAFLALALLIQSHLKSSAANSQNMILIGCVTVICGLLLQASEVTTGVVLGRLIFGYGLYQVTVHLEVMLFEFSKPEHFASDFSKVHFFQNIGIIAASFAVGSLVDHYSLSAPHYLGAAGMVITLFLFYSIYGRNRGLPNPATQATNSQTA